MNYYNCEKIINKKLFDLFCCNECSISYWQNPKKVIIKKICPNCNSKFEREVYTIELQGSLNLELCKKFELVHNII